MTEPTTGTEIAIAAPTAQNSVLVAMSERFGMQPLAFEATLRNTVFKSGTREEFAAFLLVAKEYKLNPLTKEIYAFPAKGGGIVPVVSIDGWISLCNSHPAFDGMEFSDEHDADGKLYAITCTIYRKDRTRPTAVTEYLAECVRSTEPWKMVHRMLRHKALIQAARYAFGFSGIYDQDEAEQITVDIVNEPAPALTAGFGDKPPKSRRTAKAAKLADDTGKADEAAHAPADEPLDAEFEDVAQEAGEGFQRPTETVSVQGAEAGPDSSASATDASTGSAAETSSQVDTSQARDDGPTEAEVEEIDEPAGTTAAPDEVYIWAGNNKPTDDGRFTTYKNGKPFSTVGEKAAAKVTVHDYHPTVQTVTEAAPEPEVEEEGNGPVNPFVAAMSGIANAETLAAAKQVLRRLSTTDEFRDGSVESKSAVRKALWDRYGELAEAGTEIVTPTADFTLMRLWLEYGATTAAEIEGSWPAFWRNIAYKEARDADKAAITDLKERRCAELGA
jgi:phage recombination protein Bet